jgi:Protein of unknown function (DUF3618)
MGQTPDDIRQEIEETRGRMGDTVEAIGHRADVKTRVKETVSSKKDAVVGGIDSLVSRVTGIVPDGEEIKTGARKVGVSSENPLGLAIAGAAAGFIVGTLIPSTQIEDEKVGQLSDQVGEKAKEAGQEALDRGKDVAQDALDSARQTAQEQSGEQAQELASSLHDKTQEIGSQPTP